VILAERLQPFFGNVDARDDLAPLDPVEEVHMTLGH
jgi:hypothetical protein